MKTYRFILALLFICLAIPSLSSAVELNGRFGSDLYIYDENDTSHVRPYESLRANLTLWKSNRQKLTLNSYLRFTTDLSNKRESDPQLFVYNSYLKYSGFVKGGFISLGRQYAYTAVGSSLFDGVRFKYRYTSKASIDIFGGTSVDYFDPEKIQPLDEDNVMGARLSFKSTDKSNFGLNWLRKEYDEELYHHRFGIDGGITLNKIRLYGQAAYNIDSHRLAKILYRTVYSYNKWYFSGEFSFREPTVASRSIFSLIDFNDYKQLRFEANRKLKPYLTAVSSLNYNFYDDDNSYRSSVGLLYKSYSLSWVHYSGYGGNANGITANASGIYNNWMMNMSLNLMKYEIQKDQDELSDAYSTVIGVRRNLNNNWRVGADWVMLRNAVLSSDSRFNLHISKGFDIK